MNNNFLDSLVRETNYTTTENGSITHKSTLNAVLDLFAFGGSYRSRKEDDCILLFKNAFEEDAEMALRCLFYIRDIEQGQGERRFFRVCYKWLCYEYPEIAKRNMAMAIVENFARTDDIIYSAINTPCEDYMNDLIKSQLEFDLSVSTPSLCAKWCPSANASSYETRQAAQQLRKKLGYTNKEYRIILSKLRTKINIVEKLMSENKWNEIQFDKLPSKAGLKYKNAFMTRDEIKNQYAEFMNKKETKVNADALFPQDVVSKILNGKIDNETDRKVLQKYWKNLKDIYEGKEENAIAVVDVSGSMYPNAIKASIGLGAYIAERGKGPFANYFITFSREPELVKFEGVDIVDKVTRAIGVNWGFDTNIEAVFDLLLETALKNKTKQEDLPTRLYILSDMEFNEGLNVEEDEANTLLEAIAKKWKSYGYELPQLIFWNLDARQNRVPMLKGGRFAYVSGQSQNIITSILTGKTNYDLMIEKLNSERYKKIKTN